MKKQVNFSFFSNATQEEIEVKAVVHVGSTVGRGDDPTEVISYKTFPKVELSKRDLIAIDETAREKAQFE